SSFQNFQAAAQLSLHASAFLLTHDVEFMDGLVQARQHSRLEIAVEGRGLTQCAGHTKDLVEVRFAASAKLARRLAKRRHVARNQLAVELKPLPRTALQVERDFTAAPAQSPL